MRSPRQSRSSTRVDQIPSQARDCREIAFISQARGAPIFGSWYEPTTWDRAQRAVLAAVRKNIRELRRTLRTRQDPKNYELLLTLAEQEATCSHCPVANRRRLEKGLAFQCALADQKTERGDFRGFKPSLDEDGDIRISK